MTKCKGFTKTGTPCKTNATMDGYCVFHWFKIGKRGRSKMVKKLNKTVGWKNES